MIETAPNPKTAAATSRKPLISAFWIKTIAFGLALFVVILGYDLVLLHKTFDLFLLNTELSTVGMYLIGFSFVLSSLSYFWNFADKLLTYRKYLGLAGFYAVLVHSTFSFAYYFFVYNPPLPNFDIDFNWKIGEVLVSNYFAFVAAVIAILIYIFMALISNQFAMQKLGTKWRPLLRLGYAAYVIVIVHFGLKRFETWQDWWTGGAGVFPPQSLILLVFVLFILGMRLVLLVKSKKKEQPKPSTPAVTKSTEVATETKEVNPVVTTTQTKEEPEAAIPSPGVTPEQ